MKIYVDAQAPFDGIGSKEQPFKRISDAARMAMPGDEVLVYPGVYREAVHPVHAGEEHRRITYTSVEPLGAVITGAEPVTDWTRYEGTTWVTRIPNSLFAGYNPYVEIVEGDWYFSPKDPATGEFVDMHRGAVYLNDRMLYETTTLEECMRGEVFAPSWEPQYSIYKWYTEQEQDETVIYANFHDYDPNRENVEINVRRNCFMPEQTGIGYITLRGFTVCKAATNWAPPAAYQDGMIGAHWSKGWIIEDCHIHNSKCCGISLGNYHQTEKDNDNYFTRKHVKSPTQMERDAVCIAQYDGWSKETVGSHIVRRCHIHDCGQTGIVGRMGCVFSVIEDNHIHHINNMQQLTGAEVAGIKFHAAIDVIFRRNHIHHCTMGIWTDWQAQGTRITQNLLHDNFTPDFLTGRDVGMGCGMDLFIEVGHGPILVDHNFLLSKAAVRWATQGVALVHNFILGSFTQVGEGTDMTANGKNQPRYTPYHIPHRTEVAGFMTILHGDNRIYNNIFIQDCPVPPESELTNSDNRQVGCHVFDEYPTYDEWIVKFKPGERVDMTEMEAMVHAHFDPLPVWIDGNVYFNGAKPWNRETHCLTVEEAQVYARLYEDGGSYKLDTNVYDHMEGFRCRMITTETLGEAFEPEQKYENTDGTALVLDTDYFGEHTPITPLPGPLAGAKSLEKYLNRARL